MELHSRGMSGRYDEKYCAIQLVSWYVGSHSERGACTRAFCTSTLPAPPNVMRWPPPCASGYQCSGQAVEQPFARGSTLLLHLGEVVVNVPAIAALDA